MKIVSLKCPECEAPIYLEEGQTTCYCSHCGVGLLIDDEVKITKHIKVIRDEARILEAEEKIRTAKAREELEREQINAKVEEKRKRRNLVYFWLFSVFFFVCACRYWFRGNR